MLFFLQQIVSCCLDPYIAGSFVQFLPLIGVCVRTTCVGGGRGRVGKVDVLQYCLSDPC